MKRSEFIKNVLAFGAVIGLAPKVMAAPESKGTEQWITLPDHSKNLLNKYTHPITPNGAYLIPDVIELISPGRFELKFKSYTTYPKVGNMLIDDLDKSFVITRTCNFMDDHEFPTKLTILRASSGDIYDRKKNFLSSRRRHGKKIVSDVTGKTFVVFCNSMRERS